MPVIMRVMLAIFGFIFVVVMAIILLAHGGPKNATTPNSRNIKLSSYVNDNSAKMEYVIEGPINASENHDSIKIVIGPTSRTLDVIQGYQG